MINKYTKNAYIFDEGLYRCIDVDVSVSLTPTKKKYPCKIKHSNATDRDVEK